MRLRHLFTGELTWRELDVYLTHLPLESAVQTVRMAQMSDEEMTAAASHEHQHGPWSHTDLLLAAVVDGIARLTFVQVRRAGATPDPPKPLPRPGLRAAVRPINPAAAAYLNSLRAKGA